MDIRNYCNKPKILFADEPTANPDSVSSRQILELFRALNRDMGQTILMVTHELEDADLVDRVIWLADGEVVEREGQGCPGGITSVHPAPAPATPV
jgi:putative ABC transport system ATP-binding protein